MAESRQGTQEGREGGSQAPTRYPLDWKNPAFYDEDAVFQEMERVFQICHECRRCFSLCHAFPTLFDLVDESETMEVDGVAKGDYWKVVEQCYLCDLCYMTKCPYVPPHEWEVDFPHLMLRAKAVHFEQHGARPRDRMLANTDRTGRFAGIPVMVQAVNATNHSRMMRRLMHKWVGIHQDAHLPDYHSDTYRKRFKRRSAPALEAEPAGRTQGKVALFVTCYGNYNEPDVVDDLTAVFEHNGIPVTVAEQERCCAMPKLELGDLKGVEAAKDFNVPRLARLVDEGYDIVGPVPSCVLMFKQELPLMFPDDPEVQKVKEHTFDPMEYLSLRHKDGKLNTEFKNTLGKLAHHVPCHQRVQAVGNQTRAVLELVPDTEFETIERCSGHDGTYAVKAEFHDISKKICRPVARRVGEAQASHYTSDCPLAGHQIANTLDDGSQPRHPVSLLRDAYGI